MKIILPLLLICFSCVTNYQNMNKRFKDIPKYNGRELYKFVSNVHTIKDSSIIAEGKITGIVSVSAVIDENGNVAATSVKESINPKIDSLVIKAILDSKFKKMMGSNGQFTKYVINITHVFYNGMVLSPLVNGISVKEEDPKSPLSEKISNVETSGNSEKPAIVYFARPIYPDEAKRAVAVGRVVVLVEIKEDGLVGNMDILSSENNLLIIPSLEAASRCRFQPARSGGKTVKVKMAVPFDYRLH